jgi:hypothetical protein
VVADGVVVVGAVVVVPVLGTQLTLVLFVAVDCPPTIVIPLTCEVDGVAAAGCWALGVGDVAVLRAGPTVVPDCATVPVGQVEARSPPAALVADEFVPGVAVVVIPGVCPGVAPAPVPGVTLGVVP